MGWGRTLLLGDIGNRLDIEDTELDIRRLKAKLRAGAEVDSSQDRRIEFLERQNNELVMYVASLARLLVAKGIIDESQLEAMVAGIDDVDTASP